LKLKLPSGLLIAVQLAVTSPVGDALVVVVVLFLAFLLLNFGEAVLLVVVAAL
jgi:hypothetical protein